MAAPSIPQNHEDPVEVVAKKAFEDVCSYMMLGNQVASGGKRITSRITRNSMMTKGIEA